MTDPKSTSVGLVPPLDQQCDDIQDAMVVSLRSGAPTDQADWRQHEQKCAECRAFLLRTQRAQLHFQASELSATDLKRLKLRLAPHAGLKGSVIQKRRRKAPWLVGAALGLGATAALAGGAWQLLGEKPEPAAAPIAGAKTGAPPRAQKAPSVLERPPATSPAPVFAPGHAGPKEEGGSQEEWALEAPDPAVSPKATATNSQGRLVRSPAPLKLSERTERERLKWAHAAEALREDNPERASAALRDLIDSKDEATRERAQLGLAQLWLKEGKTHEARALLHKLKTSHNSFIQQRALELLK